MTTTQAVILGIVEGITEFLPISSTGHLILTSRLFGIESENFTKSFEIAIQFGAILAVVVLYWNRLLSDKETWKKVLFAFLPTAVIGFLLYKVLKNFLLSNSAIVLWSLFLGGIMLIVFELWYKKKDETFHSENISYKKAFAIGVAQALAIIPGVSRAGATIVGGLLMGISRKTIVEFSFLLAVPTMATATGYDLLKSSSSFSFDQFYILAVGFVVSFVVALLSIKWLLHFIKNHTFISFGIYRIIIAIVFYLAIIR